MARACVWLEHCNTVVGRMVKTQYGNPSGTFYYFQGLLEYLTHNGAECNEQEHFLVQLDFWTGTMITAITVDDFLATASRKESMY